MHKDVFTFILTLAVMQYIELLFDIYSVKLLVNDSLSHFTVNVCVFVNISGNIRPDSIQAINIQSLLREKIAFLSGKHFFISFLCTINLK